MPAPCSCFESVFQTHFKRRREEKKHDNFRLRSVLLYTSMARAGLFSSFLLHLCSFCSPLSLTRTQPICRETRVMDDADKTLLLRAPLRWLFSTVLCLFWRQLLRGTRRAAHWAQASATKPHSCHRLALQQYISSSQGHDSISLVITTGILIIISTADIFFMQIMSATVDWKTMRAQFGGGHIPVWLTEHLLRQEELCVCFNTMLAFSSIISSHVQSGCREGENKNENKKEAFSASTQKAFQSGADLPQVLCVPPHPSLNATSRSNVSLWENCEMQSS